jgi:hypothetical protein
MPFGNFSLPECLELKVRFKDVFALTAEKRLFTVGIGGKKIRGGLPNN